MRPSAGTAYVARVPEPRLRMDRRNGPKAAKQPWPSWRRPHVSACSATVTPAPHEAQPQSCRRTPWSSDSWQLARRNIWIRRGNPSLDSEPERSHTPRQGVPPCHATRASTPGRDCRGHRRSARGIAGAVPNRPRPPGTRGRSARAGRRGGAGVRIPPPARRRAAASPSAPLAWFGLIQVHTITPATASLVGPGSDPEGIEFGNAAIGPAVVARLTAPGMASAIAVRRRAHRDWPQVLRG